MRIKDIIPEGFFTNPTNQIKLPNVPIVLGRTLTPKELETETDLLRKRKLRRLKVYQQQIALNAAANQVSNADWQQANALNQVSLLDRVRANPHPERSLTNDPPEMGRGKRWQK